MVTGLAAALGLMLAIGVAAPPAEPSSTVRAIPDEPGAEILAAFIGSTVQAVAADLDGDGMREVARIGFDAGPRVVAEAWRFSDGGDWVRTPRVVLTTDPEFALVGGALRLLLRSVGGKVRVTLIRQSGVIEGSDEPCCFTLDDVRMTGTGLTLDPVLGPQPNADAISALDVDGDGTDELLATRSLPPLAGVSYPTEARVFRWAGDAFTGPTTTELPIGSGNTPFVLGDTDGVRGEEAGIIAVAGRPDLYRLHADDEDRVHAEAAGLVVTDALAVPVGSGHGIAATGQGFGLTVRQWPRGGGVEAPAVEAPLEGGRLLGIAGGSSPRLLARGESGETVAVDLERLSTERGDPPAPDALSTIAGTRLRPFAGPIPSGGPDGSPALIADGRLHSGTSPRAVARLAGVQPVGFVGPGHGWLALLHAPSAEDPLDPRGGRLLPASFSPETMLVVVPADVALATEADGGSLSPRTSRGSMLEDGRFVVAGDPFNVDVEGPPGSRVYVGDATSIGRDRPHSIDAAGIGHVVIPHPAGGERTAAITVITPAGHAYRAEWRLLVLSEPPALTVVTETPFGSRDVVVRGRTAPYATVTVAGVHTTVDGEGRFRALVAMPPWPTSATVVARDPLGNETVRITTGVGLLDYRALPWVPISVALVALGGALLYLRVPRSRLAARPVIDDAVLEELDPDRAD